MNKLIVDVVNKSEFDLPQYKTEGAAGIDLKANIEEHITICPMGRALVPTGLFVSIALGCEAQVRPRSGLAINNGITVLNAPGTIDSDYRGEIKVVLINLGQEDFVINKGDRIAQLVFARHEQVEFNEVIELDETVRGKNGFGHTGIKG